MSDVPSESSRFTISSGWLFCCFGRSLTGSGTFAGRSGLLTLATTPASSFFISPGDPYRFDKLTFGAPVSFWFGYPLHLYIGHFWSLCVEEQFYLIWPFVVYQVRKRETLIKLCIAVIILSPIVRAGLAVALPPQLLRMELFYRSLPTRLDALLIGGLIALLLRGPEEALLRQLRRPLLTTASVLFVALYLVSTKVLALPFEGSASNWIGVFGFTLIDIFAAALIPRMHSSW